MYPGTLKERHHARPMKQLDTLKDLVDHLQKVAPEVIELATASTEEEFALNLDKLLERAARHLEANSNSFYRLNEVGLSGVVAAFLNGMPGINAVQEGHSNGHVDLTITANLTSPVQRRLAEAKIENGPAYHEKGLDQLLGRYSTGRDRYAWLLVYVKVAGIKYRLDEIRTFLNMKKPHKQKGACRDHGHNLKWFFHSDHEHSSGEEITVTHVGFNLNPSA